MYMKVLVFMLEMYKSVWDELGRTCVACLVVSHSSSSTKTGTRQIICVVELSWVAHLERRSTKHSSSQQIICLVPFFY